jgi:BioD-like phosphotransacetylase family protein
VRTLVSAVGGVEIIGVIANKVLPDKLDQTRHYMSKALNRMGLPLFGVIPYAPRLTWPTVQQVADRLKAKIINGHNNVHNPVRDIVIGAMTPHNALSFIEDQSFLIVPGDRDDLVLAAMSFDLLREDIDLSGILFTGGILPQPQTIDLLTRTDTPVLIVDNPTYEVAARIQKLTVKIQVKDDEKIQIAANLVREHVDLEGIWKALG